MSRSRCRIQLSRFYGDQILPRLFKSLTAALILALTAAPVPSKAQAHAPAELCALPFETTPKISTEAFSNWASIQATAFQITTLEQLHDFAQQLKASPVPRPWALRALLLTRYALENNSRLVILARLLDGPGAESAKRLPPAFELKPNLTTGIKPESPPSPFAEPVTIEMVHATRDALTFRALAMRLAEMGAAENLMNLILSQTPFANDQKLSSLELESSARSFKETNAAIENWFNALRELQRQGKDPRPSSRARRIESALVLNKEVRNRKVLDLLRGGDLKPDLLFTWKVNKPDGLAKRPDGSYEAVALNDPSVEFRGSPYDEAAPLTRVRKIFSSPHPLPNFYESVYAHYETRIRDELVQLVERVEQSLPESRQSWGEVFDPVTHKVISTVRIFDGTVLREEDLFTGASPRSRAEDRLVFERILAARDLESQWSRALQRVKARHPFQKIFEIGKLSLDINASPELRDRALNMLELFMLDHYLTLYPDAIFIAHTATAAHQALYRRRWGFKVVEEIKIPGTDQTEQVLVVSSRKLREKIAARLKLPSAP